MFVQTMCRSSACQSVTFRTLSETSGCQSERRCFDWIFRRLQHNDSLTLSKNRVHVRARDHVHAPARGAPVYELAPH